jgi:hypothetical protein
MGKLNVMMSLFIFVPLHRFMFHSANCFFSVLTKYEALNGRFSIRSLTTVFYWFGCDSRKFFQLFDDHFDFSL